MLVHEIRYLNEAETITMLFEDYDNSIEFIKESLTSAIKRRIVQYEVDLHESFGHYERTTYYTSIINDYIRVLSALEHTFTINDLNDIDYMSVINRIVYTKQ